MSTFIPEVARPYIPKPNDWIIILANVLFFMVVQTYFFKYIASQQYEYVLETKLQFLRTLAKHNPEFAYLIQHSNRDAQEKYKKTAESQHEQRKKANDSLEFMYCWIPIICTSALIVAIIFFKHQKWTRIDTYNLLFVMLAYSTELFIFFFVIRKYLFIGDNNLWTRILDKQLVRKCEGVKSVL